MAATDGETSMLRERAQGLVEGRSGAWTFLAAAALVFILLASTAR